MNFFTTLSILLDYILIEVIFSKFGPIWPKNLGGDPFYMKVP